MTQDYITKPLIYMDIRDLTIKMELKKKEIQMPVE